MYCFLRFSEAANAFENCDKKYKAVFAKPKKNYDEREGYQDYGGPSHDQFQRHPHKRSFQDSFNEPPCPDMFPDEGYHKLMVIANPMLTQDQLWVLFDLIPSKFDLNKLPVIF